MTEWDVDFTLTCSQKCVGVVAGLSLCMLRERALQAFERRKTRPSAYFASWSKWLPIMKAYEDMRPSYFATPPVNHIFALRQALESLLSHGGMEARFSEHRRTANCVKEMVQILGLSEVAAHGSRANTLSCVRYPAGLDAGRFLGKVKENGAIIAGGLHKEIKGEYFRIGHLGPSSRKPEHILVLAKVSQGRQSSVLRSSC